MVQKSLCKNSYDAYTNEELLILFKENNKDLKEYFYERNKPLILSIVKRFTYDQKEDLFQIACVGFMKAFNQYNPNYNVKFTTYAVPLIIGEIKKYFRDNGSVHVARSLKENYLLIMKQKEMYEQKNMKQISMEELSKLSGLKMEDIFLSFEANQYIYSFDDLLFDEKGDTYTLLDVTSINDKENILFLLSLYKEFSKLEDKEKILLYYRYFKNYTQKQLEVMFKMSQVQISRLEKKILLKLREKFEIE